MSSFPWLKPVQAPAAVSEETHINKGRGMNKYCMIVWVFVSVMVAFFQVSPVSAGSPKDLTVEQACPGLATRVLKLAKMVKMEGGILLKTDGIEIQEALIRDIVDRAEPKIQQQLRKNLLFLLEQEATTKILVKEARTAGVAAGGLTDDQAVKAFLNRMVQGTAVSEREARSFYDKNKDMVGGIPFEQVKESIQQFLLQQRKMTIIDSYIRNLGQRADMRINRDWVKAQYALAMDNPVDKARTSGKPTMVEFGATGCIPCDMMQPILKNMRKKYGDRLNVVFVHVGENQVLGARFGIRSIPVQVFFDRNGAEIFRHEGFFAEAKVTNVISKMGVK